MRCVVAATALLSLCSTASAQETEWLVAPYLWYADITLEQSAGGGGGGGGLTGSELLDITDAFGMIRIEAARSHWGVSLDYIYLSVSDTAQIDQPPGLQATVRGEVTLSVLELAAVYSIADDGTGLQAIAGMRNIGVDKLLLLTPPGSTTQRFEADDSFTDVMIGARFLHRFNERWDLTARGDYSFGDSEGTVNLIATAGFRFNDLFSINAGYRHASLEYEDSDSAVADSTTIELSGPILGFLFRF